MDRIANLIISLKNAGMVGKEKIFIPYSKLLENIANLLMKYNYVKAVRTVQKENSVAKFLEVVVAYDEAGVAKIREVARVSKSSTRVYANTKRLPIFKHGKGLVVMTTPKGIMSAADAKKEHVGGEVLFKIF
jgi:small subunit ribosomal protein S8